MLLFTLHCNSLQKYIDHKTSPSKSNHTDHHSPNKGADGNGEGWLKSLTSIKNSASNSCILSSFFFCKPSLINCTTIVQGILPGCC